MFDREDILIEIARTIRECEAAVHAKVAAEQLGEAFIGLEKELAHASPRQ